MNDINKRPPCNASPAEHTTPCPPNAMDVIFDGFGNILRNEYISVEVSKRKTLAPDIVYHIVDIFDVEASLCYVGGNKNVATSMPFVAPILSGKDSSSSPLRISVVRQSTTDNQHLCGTHPG